MRYTPLIYLLAVLLLASGCGSVISGGLVKEADRDAMLGVVQSRIDEYRGRTVLWGGVIIKTENLADASVVEVLETPLTWTDRPKEPSEGGSRGRFLIKSKRYLDPAIYKEGKRVTVAGVVEGVEKRKIGEMEYPYPVISPLELKIFEPLPELTDYPGPGPWWYGPYDPFWPYPPGYPRYPYYPYHPRHYPYW